MSNQGPGAGRGGFQPQGGRGRGNFTPQFQPNMGYVPPGGNFRNGPNQGRGAMAPPFQGQRPMNQFPNSPHQAARSPALTNSIPGTPNIGQAMPMANQQYYNYPQQHMPGPQVNHHSIFNHHSDPFKPNKAGRGKKWSSNNEKFSNGHRKEHSRELFSHTYTTHEQMPSAREINGHNDTKIGSMPSERSGPGHLPHFNQVNGPMSPLPLEHQHSSADLCALPPLPPAIPPPTFPPLIPYPKMDATNIMKMDISPEGGGFEQFLTMSQQQNFQGYPPPFDTRMGMPMQQAPYMYPAMGQMNAYMNAPPQSPQPNFQQPSAYIPSQYGAQTQPMSRNSSQMSEQRPASSMGGQPGTPSMTPSVSNTHTPQPKAAPSASPSNFSRPARKSAAIQIKKPDGEAVDLSNFKAPASPAPRDRTRTPPVIASTPTPPPKSSTPLHTRTDSSAVGGKNAEQVRLEMMEKVKKAAESEKATDSQAKADEAARVAAETKAKEEEKAMEEAKAAEEAKAKEESDAKAAEEKRKQEEEEELERQIREIEEAEAAEEKRQAEITKKRAAEKKAADEVAAELRKANAAEEDRKLREAEREMERWEDEKERKRAEAESKSQPDTDTEKKETKEDDKNAPTTPSTLASKLSNLTLGTDSGTSTPASDDSMGPPPKIPSTEKRGKPAALNLAPLNTKPVEPPQPSAALQSLKSARFLTVLNSSIYPPNISSPNPALNSAVTTKGKSFKYDKEFLLQFQKVFIEKPSMEFESQIKALIGDGDGGSARSASTRTSSGMGPRQNSSRNNPPGAFAMGSFGAVGGKTLPPGTTSADRFAMSNNTMARPAINPMASFNRPGGAFPGGSSMTRTPSSSTMNSMPHSPRQQSRSQRGGGSKRDGYQASNAKQEAQAAKTMPLTAGVELKPIQISEKGWKPRSIGATQSATGAAGPTPGASGAGHMDPDMVQRKVKAALNKMTPEKFDKIADQILTIAAQSKDEADGRTLRQVIQLTFEKATDEAHWASMYARFCKRMLETMSPDIKDESILDKNGNIVSGGNLFRKYLLNRCQEEFERGWKMDLPEKPEGERGEEKTEEAAMLSDEYYIAAAAKRRGLGLVQFIGELYKLSMLTERIMHECVKKLVDYTGIPDEAEIESLTKLLKTIGANLDSTEKGKPMMDVYFSRIQTMIDTPDLPSRLRFMLMDIVDLRKARWQSKETNKGPKTLDEVRAEVSLQCHFFNAT
jgi:translation initiation factor 4G